MGKYDNWTRGEDEALLNMIGGLDVARAILRGKRKIIVEEVAKPQPPPQVAARRYHRQDGHCRALPGQVDRRGR
jgi:hypothetical protein